ncbi:hypothetical protein [Roseovarius autotrophicus]|uniref:hypothetical protein n=1 Tax=Roseovarius autotrophicus TaxID=2824121 RepID=UPI001B371F34|nr:hypothetical protein [Roseovarius autotrophicus]
MVSEAIELEKAFPPYGDLQAQDKEAIREFSLIWTCFERTISEKTIILSGSESLNAGKLRKLAAHLRHKGFSGPRCEAAYQFWHARYDGLCSEGLKDALHCQASDKSDLLHIDLFNPDNDKAALNAAFVITYRLRSNLFHGMKWQDRMVDQKENFDHASQVMLEVMLHLNKGASA